MLLLPCSLALAEYAGTLPGHAVVVYGGPALTTYRQLSVGTAPPGGDLDRAMQARLDLYGAWGASDRLQLAAYVPVVYSTVASYDVNCTAGSDFCAAVAGVGKAGVQARYRLPVAAVTTTLGLGVSSAAWNADTRGRYTAVGEATTDLAPALFLGRDLALGAMGAGVVLFGTYDYRLVTYDQAPLPHRAPADDVRAGLEVKVSPGVLTAQLGGYTYQRLGGVDFSADIEHYFDTDDRWAVLDYDNASVGAKLSVGLPHAMGVHLAVNRVVWVRNGPPDAVDVSLGVHKYWSPKGG
jgi:hypothetical protein